MIRINPKKMTTGGDTVRAKEYYGQARSQMEILKNQMSFQDLKQSIRRVWLHKDVYIECIKIYDYEECRIWVRPFISEPLDGITNRYLVVYSTESGEEAVLWDLINNTHIFLGTLQEIKDILEDTTDIYDILEERGVEEIVEAECIADLDQTWDVQEDGSPFEEAELFLPQYTTGTFIQPSGYSWSATYPYGSIATWTNLGLLDEVTWNIPYIDESPLPYPQKSLIVEDIGIPNAIDEKASYINTFIGVVEDDLGWAFPDPEDRDRWEADVTELKDEFEELSGMSWPSQNFGVYRFVQFWSPFFWYSMSGMVGHLDQIGAEGFGIKLADSWSSEDSEWAYVSDGDNTYPELIKPPLTLQKSGIAYIEYDDDVDSIIFEYVSVCRRFTDIYGSQMCQSDDDETLSQHLMLWTRGITKSNGLVQGVLDATNEYRDSASLHQLVYSEILSASASAHASWLASEYNSGRKELSHIGEDGSDPEDRIVEKKYFLGTTQDYWVTGEDPGAWGYAIGENIAITSSDSVVESVLLLWKESPGHNANLLFEDYSELGVGSAITNDGKVIVCQNFGGIDSRYPGFNPYDVSELQLFVKENFTYNPEIEESRVPRMFLIGNVEITAEQLELLMAGEED